MNFLQALKRIDMASVMSDLKVRPPKANAGLRPRLLRKESENLSG
jgi:hypothetical protein